jgi:hypothetical protein
MKNGIDISNRKIYLILKMKLVRPKEFSQIYVQLVLKIKSKFYLILVDIYFCVQFVLKIKKNLPSTKNVKGVIVI